MNAGSRRSVGPWSLAEVIIQLMTHCLATLRRRDGAGLLDMYTMSAAKSGVQDRLQFQKSGEAEQERRDGA